MTNRYDWFRLPTDLDAKVQQLSSALFKAWVNLLCIAADSEVRGTLPDTDTIAWHLRLSRKKARATLVRFAAEQLLTPDLRAVVNWEQYDPSGHRTGRLEWARRRLELTDAVLERDGAVCRHCGATSSLSIDHIWPIAQGGTSALSNLQVLCRPCNSSKGARVGLD